MRRWLPEEGHLKPTLIDLEALQGDKGQDMEPEQKVKWGYSEDGNIRFLVSEDRPDIVKGFCYQPERLNEPARKGCESLNSENKQSR